MAGSVKAIVNSGPEKPTSDDLAPLRVALGDLLTARRNAAGLTQRQLAHQTSYARSTIGGAEAGHRVPAESFWKRCDQSLDSGGELLRAYHQLAAARSDHKQHRDRAAQAQRDARHSRSPQPALVRSPDRTGDRRVTMAAVSEWPARGAVTPVPALTPSPGSLSATLMAAARESSADALLRAGDLGPATIPHLVERVRYLARSYNGTPPAVTFLEAKELADLALKVMQATHRPQHLADLYAVLGQTTALMGSMAFDLGRWDAAALLTRCATAYADLAGHASLMAWTYGLQATVAFWRGDAPAALEAIDRGLLVAPAGNPRARLRYIAARAYAVDGDTAGVAAALQEAAVDADSGVGGYDELQDDIGGEFRFDGARAAACAGAAWLQAGDGARAEMCVRGVLDGPGDALGEGIAAGARLDLAAALLLQGELAGATAELDAVLVAGVGPVHAAAVVGRVRRVHHHLALPQWRTDTAAGQLRDAAAAWLNAAVLPEPATTS